MAIVKYNPTVITVEEAIRLLPPKAKRIWTLLDIVRSDWPRELLIKELEKAKEIVRVDPKDSHFDKGYRLAFLDTPENPKFTERWFYVETTPGGAS